jgi:hypothetical protein
MMRNKDVDLFSIQEHYHVLERMEKCLDCDNKEIQVRTTTELMHNKVTDTESPSCRQLHWQVSVLLGVTWMGCGRCRAHRSWNLFTKWLAQRVVIWRWSYYNRCQNWWVSGTKKKGQCGERHTNTHFVASDSEQPTEEVEQRTLSVYQSIPGNHALMQLWN